MKIKTLFLASALLFAQPIFAQTPSDESINKMMSLMKMEQTLHDMEAAMPIAMEKMLAASLEQDAALKKLPPKKAQQIKEIIQKYANEAAKESVGNKLIQAALFDSFSKTAKRHYTQAEVNAMNAFLSTPEGASFTAKQGKVMAEFMPDFMEATAPIQNQILQQKMALAGQEIQKLMAKPKSTPKNQKKKQ